MSNTAEAAPPLAAAPARRAGAYTFGFLFASESLVRAFNASVLSIQAHDLLGSSQKVSVLSTAVSLAVLAATLNLPNLLRRLSARHAYFFGITLLVTASLLIASFTLPGQAFGVFLRNTGAAVLQVMLSLYILDNIPRDRLAETEPLRLTFSVVSWTVGPAAGVWLYTRHGPLGPQIAAIVAALVLIVFFARLRLAEPRAQAAVANRPYHALANVRRFAAQPRLRLAWIIAFGRSCFWSGLFIYGPLLMLEGGESKMAAGLLLSLSQAMLLITFLYGRLARHMGVRRVITLCLVLAAGFSFAAGVAGPAHPLMAGGLLLAGALATTGLDGVGGIPFLRAVRPHEKTRMAAVYRTFIEVSEIIPGFIFALILSLWDLGAAFMVLGCGLAVVAGYAWHYLPKSL